MSVGSASLGVKGHHICLVSIFKKNYCSVFPAAGSLSYSQLASFSWLDKLKLASLAS